MIRRFCLAIGMAALCFNAAAKPAPLPMPLGQDLPVEVVMSQHELAVDVPVGNGGMVGAQFGLIGALVGSIVQSAVQNAQTKKAEERAVPMRNQLLAYNFNQRAEAVLRAKLASEGISPNPQIRIMATPWDAADAQQDKQGMPPRALVITPRYSMDYPFNTMSVTLLAQVVDRTIRSNGKIKTTYAFSRNYAYHFPLAGALGDDNPQNWAGMGSERLAALLDQGLEQATDMLVYDLSAAGRAQWGEKIKREKASVNDMTYAGRAVKQGDGWIWVRTTGVLQGYQPTSAVAAPAAAASPALAAPAAAAIASATPAATTPATSSASAAITAQTPAPTPAAATSDSPAPAETTPATTPAAANGGQ